VARQTSTRGFTLIELIIGLLLGTIILSAAITFLITHMRSLEGADIRENVARNDRYIGALLRRDLQLTGIDITSRTEFATVGVWPGTVGDTLFLLYVPFVPEPAPSHDVEPTEDEPAEGEGTCGPRCMEVLYDDTKPIEIEGGDLARLEVEGVRRLIMVTDVVVDGIELEISFTDTDTLLRQPAGLKDLQVEVPGTLIQKLAVVMYYIDDEGRLIRAQRLNPDGTPDGDVVAFGVEDFDAALIFADGDTLEIANPYDSDTSNDYDDIVGVQVRVTVTAERADPRVNNGLLLKKTTEWRISPRNLRYQKNRV
jgi:prepilin-type N-terminal cleavage/methylation domain-containing protein